jgi:NDP-sugar pyrophosphorylase family protein
MASSAGEMPVGSNDRITKAMVLAAGEGTRLQPLTLRTPKALLPVAGVPLIIRTLAWLRGHGVLDVAINLHHLGHMIERAVGDGSRLELNVHYSAEDKLLGTAGAVKKMEPFFDGPFVLVYGDVLTDANLTEMARLHRERSALATIALHRVSDPSQAGIVQIDSSGRVGAFVEKPPAGSAHGNFANGGVYILERTILKHIPADTFCDFGYDVFPLLVGEKQPVYGYPLPETTYLVDIGTPTKYRQANRDMLGK